MREDRVSGWSAPSSRSQSARVCSNSGIASPRRPACPVSVGEVVARGQGVGVVGAQQPLAVGDQGLAVLDCLGEAVAEFVHAPQRPPAQVQKGSGQLGVITVQAGGQVLM